MDGHTYGQTDFPCVLQDFVPFGAADQKRRVDTAKKWRVDTLKKGRVDTSTLCANVRLLRSSASVRLFVIHLPQARVSVYAAMFLHEHFFNVCHLFMCVLAHL